MSVELTPVPGATPRYDDDGNEIVDVVTCGACGRSWNDAAVSSWTPAPSGRCPFEYEHDHDHGVRTLHLVAVTREHRSAKTRTTWTEFYWSEDGDHAEEQSNDANTDSSRILHLALVPVDPRPA